MWAAENLPNLSYNVKHVLRYANLRTYESTKRYAFAH